MTARPARLFLTGVGLILFLCGSFFIWTLWASSGGLPAGSLAQVKRFPVASSKDSFSETFTVMTYNIGYLSGMSNNLPVRESRGFFLRNLKTVASLLQDVRPDFVGFQEIDFGAHRSYGMNQLDSLALQAAYPQAAVAVNWDKNYVPYPYWPPKVHFGRVLSGQAVLSRYPILSHERVVLPRPEDSPAYYDAFYLDRLAEVVTVDVGRPLVLINVHLEAYDTATRVRQVKALVRLCEKYVADFPLLLIGDFNSLPPSFDPRKLGSAEFEAAARRDSTIALLLAQTGLKDAFPDSFYTAHERETYTFSSAAPQVKIDYVFYNATKIEPVQWFVATGAGQASDHLPVVVRFKLKG